MTELNPYETHFGNTIIPLTIGEEEMRDSGEDPVSTFYARWDTMKREPEYMDQWLQAQYKGEIDAVATMEALLKSFGTEPKLGKQAMLVERVIADERNHVELIGQLLISRGIKPEQGTPQALPHMDLVGKGCAVASRAEAIRAGQIRIVIGDEGCPEDVRNVFTRVLKEESFHEKAFRHLAGDEEMRNHTQFLGWDEGRIV